MILKGFLEFVVNEYFVMFFVLCVGYQNVLCCFKVHGIWKLSGVRGIIIC